MGDAVAVREASSADIDAAVALWTMSHVVRRNGRPLPEGHIASAHQRMAEPGAMLLLAQDLAQGDRESAEEGQQPGLIGTIIGVQGRDKDGAGSPIPGLLHISLLSVAPDRWGQHVGRLLVEEMISRSSELSFEQAQLWTHADNLRANRLYKAMGFRRSGRVRVDDWGELLVHYRRALAV